MAAPPKDKTEYRQLRDTVYTFFYYSNKPIATSEIALQFKSCKKQQIQEVLDDLVEKEKIFVKVFNKAKVYCLTQCMCYEVDDNVYTEEIDREQNQDIEDRTLRYLKWSQGKHSEELSILKDESKRLDCELGKLENKLSDEEMIRAIELMEKTVRKHSKEEKVELVEAKDFNKKKKLHIAMKKTLEERKRIFRDAVNSICDGCGLKKSDLLADSGIE